MKRYKKSSFCCQKRQGFPLSNVITYHSGENGSQTPILFSSPHSGRQYPDSFLALTALPFHILQRMEDRFVDHLLTEIPSTGSSVLEAHFPRSLCDVNRNWQELDPTLFHPPLNPAPLQYTTKVKSGYGVIPRCASPGQSIYRHCLPHKEATTRLLTYWQPYHLTLRHLLAKHHKKHHYAVLFDMHSMPQLIQTRPCDIVLGDSHGQSCSPILVKIVEQAFTRRGYHVQRNIPYAGGYITQHYGHPHRNQHVLQIEICRSLYINPQTLAHSRTFHLLRNNLLDIFSEITEWLMQTQALLNP